MFAAHLHQPNCLAHTCRLGHIVSNYHCVARLAKDTTGQQVGWPVLACLFLHVHHQLWLCTIIQKLHGVNLSELRAAYRPPR